MSSTYVPNYNQFLAGLFGAEFLSPAPYAGLASWLFCNILCKAGGMLHTACFPITSHVYIALFARKRRHV